MSTIRTKESLKDDLVVSAAAAAAAANAESNEAADYGGEDGDGDGDGDLGNASSGLTAFDEDGYVDEVDDNLDLDNLIQTEFSNEKIGINEITMNSSFELYGGKQQQQSSPLKLLGSNNSNNNNYYKLSDSPSAVSAESTTSSLSSLKTAATALSSNASKLTTSGYGVGDGDLLNQSGLSGGGDSAVASCFNTICEDDLADHRGTLRQLFMKEFFDKYECSCDVPMGQFMTKRSKLSKSLQRKLANFYQLLHQLASAASDGDGGFDQITIDRLIAQSPNMPIHELISSLQKGGGISPSMQDENNGKDAEALKAASIYNIIQNQEYKKKLFRSMRSIAERICIDALAICDQYHNQLQQQEQMIQSNASTAAGQIPPNPINYSNPTTKLWSEVRSRGCQFLGPQMQDDVLRLILHALETMTRMSRKLLVLYVVFMLKKHYPKASKTSVGHVVQLLYRAGCFKVEKRENDSSLMELKKEFAKYPALRRQHDSQIIQIALESGIRMSPEQWSQKLFGDATHKSEMQSIIDKLHSQQTLEKLASDFYEKLNSNMSASSVNSLLVGNNNHNSHSEALVNSIFLRVKSDFDFLASVNFEKKQPVVAQSAGSQEAISRSGKKGHAITDSMGNYVMGGSGAESLNSDTESNLDHNDREATDNFLLEDDDFFDNDENLKARAGGKHAAAAQPEQQQTKIVWPLLKESLHKAINILEAYLEYSSKMLTIIIANNNFINNNSSSNPPVNQGGNNNLSSSNAAAVTRSISNRQFGHQQSDLSSSNGSLNLINNSVNNNSNKGPMNNMRPNGSSSFVPRGGYQNSAGGGGGGAFKPNNYMMKQQTAGGGEPFSMAMKFKPSQNVDDMNSPSLFMGSQQDTTSLPYDSHHKLYNNRSSDKVVMHALIQQMGPNNMAAKQNGGVGGGGFYNQRNSNNNNQFGGGINNNNNFNNNQYGSKQYNNNNSKKSDNNSFGANYFNQNSYQNNFNGGGKLGNQSSNVDSNMFGGGNNFLDFQDMQKSLFEGVNLGMMMPSSQGGYNAFADTASSLLFDPAQLNDVTK